MQELSQLQKYEDTLVSELPDCKPQIGEFMQFLWILIGSDKTTLRFYLSLSEIDKSIFSNRRK